MPALLLAAVLAAQTAPAEPARAQARVSITIISGAEIHFATYEDRRENRFEHKQVRGEDGVSRPALLVEFQ